LEARAEVLVDRGGGRTGDKLKDVAESGEEVIAGTAIKGSEDVAGVIKGLEV
jgi:hypothetical protein